MIGNPVPSKNAPVLDEEKIKESLRANSLVSQFAKEGKKLLEQTNRPNVITVEQFMPFLDLFTMGEKERERYENDKEYELSINRLYNEFIRGLGINLYEPTIVIRSKDDPHTELVLDRRFTRIRSDNIEGRSHRDAVPTSIARNASVTRDQLLQDASARDLIAVNSTPEAKQYFARIRMQSALIQKWFVERNLSPDKRPVKTTNSEGVSVTEKVGSSVIFDDDD